VESARQYLSCSHGAVTQVRTTITACRPDTNETSGTSRGPLAADNDKTAMTAGVFGTFKVEGRQPVGLYRVLANSPMGTCPRGLPARGDCAHQPGAPWIVTARRD
jgi:hypothetical protein